jgi:hypothetical protein
MNAHKNCNSPKTTRAPVVAGRSELAAVRGKELLSLGLFKFEESGVQELFLEMRKAPGKLTLWRYPASEGS